MTSILKPLLLTLALITAAPSLPTAIAQTQAPAPASAPDATVSASVPTAEEMMRFLAADEQEGRLAGSPGYQRAARYVADQFAAIGLQPAGDAATWFQNFTLGTTQVVPDDCSMTMALNNEPLPPLAYGDDYMPFRFSAAGKIVSQVVFVGYGITSPEHKYDDYANLNVKGKIVLMFRYEPAEKDNDSPFDGSRHTMHATFASKIDLAQRQGARAILIVTGPHYYPRGQGFYAAKSSASPTETTIPVAQISQKLAADMFKAAGRDLLSVQQTIDRTHQPASFVIDNVAVTLRVASIGIETRHQNVVARLPGSNPQLKDQVVIIGAHLDHIGTEHGYHTRKSSDLIFNGADDNASGVVAMIIAARALAAAPEKPQRSILFIAFDAEEQGLHGSRYYVDNPLVPLDDTPIMINLDMVGRAVASSVYAYFSKSADSLAIPLRNQGDSHGLKMLIRYGEGLPTDSLSFAMAGVPTISFSTGVHPDYHGVGDTADKINMPDLQRLGLLTADLARTAASSTDLKRTTSFIRPPRKVSPPAQPSP